MTLNLPGTLGSLAMAAATFSIAATVSGSSAAAAALAALPFAGSALLAGKSGTLRVLPLDLEAAAGVTAAAFLASGFAPEVTCCGALQMHELDREAVPGTLLLLLCKRKIIIAFDIKLQITVISLLGSSIITHLQHVSDDQSKVLASQEEAGPASCNLLPRLAKQGPDEMKKAAEEKYQAGSAKQLWRAKRKDPGFADFFSAEDALVAFGVAAFAAAAFSTAALAAAGFAGDLRLVPVDAALSLAALGAEASLSARCFCSGLGSPTKEAPDVLTEKIFVQHSV
ncbi:MAG: hypothetical protein FRX49_02444 [Trebouxia sp. A1-2]|nr:MAG: hypothetical protein FRX49_02444 [Trebouxia sp. A1-2]